MFIFYFLYSFILPIVPLSNSLSTHPLKLSPLCLTFSQNSLKLTLSNSHLSVSPSLKTLSSSLSQTLTSLSHHCRPDSIPNVTAHRSSMSSTYQLTHFVELPSRRSTLNPHRRFASDPSRRSTSLMLSTFLNSLSETLTSKLSPLFRCHRCRSTPLTRLAFK